MQRALDHVNVSAYAYIMKTRTDLAVMVPFDFATAAGRSARFSGAFTRFITTLREVVVNPPVRPCDALSIWIYTFGLDTYIPGARLVAKRSMAWCPLTNADITPALQHALGDACVTAWGGVDDVAGWMYLADTYKVAALISSMFTTHHVMLLVGSTWLNWGASEDFLRVHTTINSKFGSLSFRKLPLPWAHLSVPSWKPGAMLTESHVRISHLVSGASLVDAFDKHDYEFSFAHEFPLHCRTWEQLQNNTLALMAGVFLMRDAPSSCAFWWPPGSSTMAGVWPPSPSSTPTPSKTRTPTSSPPFFVEPTVPLTPPPWTVQVNRTTNRTYWFNIETNESSYERPH